MNKVMVTRDGLCSIADDVVATIIRKNHDYGDAWQKQGIAGVLVRLSDKLCRVSNVAGRECLVADENIEDSLRDAIGYAMLGLLYLKESVNEHKD